MKFLDRFLKSNKNLKTWTRYWFGRNRTEYKLTRAGISNDMSLVSRSEPYTASIRSRYTHVLEKRFLDVNRKAYEILNTQFNNNFKKLDQIENIKINHPWVTGQNIKVMENLTLKEVLDQILTNFEFETKDMNRFSILMSMIDNYLDPIQETDESDKEFELKKIERLKTPCPLFIFREGEKNPRKPYTKSTSIDELKKSPVTSGQGQTADFEKNFHRDKTLFPGDIRIHWEFLNGISNSTHCNQIPSIQIHEINVYSEKNGNGDVIRSNVPYLSFFMPTALFEESIVGRRK